MSRVVIESFYDAFARLDGAAMEAAYAENATFRDPAFTLSGRARIGGMWRMLTDVTRDKGKDVWRLEASAITENSAHWEAHYRFSATGRMVHNIIDARFVFDKDDKIVEHVDTFDFWRWSRQSLGTPGLLLGWTPFLRNKVRATAAKNLDGYLAKKK
jgi:ketosteroid isomerase-like protein